MESNGFRLHLSSGPGSLRAFQFSLHRKSWRNLVDSNAVRFLSEQLTKYRGFLETFDRAIDLFLLLIFCIWFHLVNCLGLQRRVFTVKAAIQQNLYSMLQSTRRLQRLDCNGLNL